MSNHQQISVDDESNGGGDQEFTRTQSTQAERENISEVEEGDLSSNHEVVPQQKSFLRRFFIFADYPIATWFIIINELCERFAFYGFKTILSLYLKNYLLFSEDNATIIVHSFVFLAYFTPLVGGFLADAILGKYWTIVILSSIYCVGQIVISVTAIDGLTGTPPHWYGCVIGLILVAIGTGGIKPNVSTMGGDQFKENQSELIASFFAVFYFSINLGSTVSSFVSPIIRTSAGYAVAFAVPAVLLVIATIIFAIGKRWYVIVPPTGFNNNPLFRFCKVMATAISLLFKRRNQQPVGDEPSDSAANSPQYDDEPKTWIDRALVKHSKKDVYDAKCVWSVGVMLLPIIIFWSLFDQHSSRFVFQAELMDRKVGDYEFGADQITTLNPVLIIILVVVFDRVIYKLLNKCFNLTPLKKISIGMVITTLSFVCAAVLEAFVRMNPNQVHVAWQIPQYVLLSVGEIFVSVTGLEFAYSQSPKEMKSLMQAYYLLTVSMGNVVVVIVASLPIPDAQFKQVYEFSFFAFLMLVALVVHLLMSRRYHYRKIKTFTGNSTVEPTAQNQFNMISPQSNLSLDQQVELEDKDL